MKNSDKIILDLAGGTGGWSKYYRDNGYTVFVITLPDYDLLLTEYGTSVYIKFKGTKSVRLRYSQIYGIIFAPVCTYFSRARSNATSPRDLTGAMYLVRAGMDVIWRVQEAQSRQTQTGMPTLKFWALENPMGVLRRFLGRPNFTFDPCDYGDPWTKKTDIWGWFNKPKKKPVEPTEGSKMHLMAPRPDRVEKRSITPPGFAEAFYRANK